MKTFNLFFRSIRAKFTLVLILCMLFVGMLSNFLVYRFALESQFNQLREKLMIVAQTASLMVDADTLMDIPLGASGVNTAQYQAIVGRLRRIKEVNRPLKYIYTMTKTDKPGIWQFIADPDLPTPQEKSKGLTSLPGDKYDANRFPEMLKSFSGPAADKRLSVDEWGVTLSGYAPIRDKNGKAVAMLGVDIMADDVYGIQKELHLRALFVLFLGILVSVVLGMTISEKITQPIKKLAEGTRHIASGDLKYKVDVKGADELSELAHAFNRMALSLRGSRRKLHNYFYRIMQSFVRVLEARDHYTRGHSERVADYAKQIAVRMGLSPDKVELLREAAILHDIGKLGIQEKILNKKEKLTEEEWELIRRHPIIGEDILRPVLLTSEMLQMVRWHHERFDGSGYPDKISGNNINIFAQIVSIADAYDAMTSLRAYRDALSPDEAIEELKRNSGTQFNPKIVEIFLAILEERRKQT